MDRIASTRPVAGLAAGVDLAAGLRTGFDAAFLVVDGGRLVGFGLGMLIPRCGPRIELDFGRRSEHTCAP
jgi:hypothetical protein